MILLIASELNFIIFDGILAHDDAHAQIHTDRRTDVQSHQIAYAHATKVNNDVIRLHLTAKRAIMRT